MKLQLITVVLIVLTVVNAKLTSNLYFPNETVTILTNFKPNRATIQDPSGNLYNLTFVKSDHGYVAKFKLERDVVLGEYYVFVDGIVENFFVDFYTINASFNGSAIVGKVEYYFVPAEFVEYEVDGVHGFVSVENGSFSIPLKIGNHTVKLRCGNAYMEIKGKLDIAIEDEDVGFLKFKTIFNGEPVKADVEAYLNDRKLNVTWDERSFKIKYKPENGILKVVAEYEGVKREIYRELNLSLSLKFGKGVIKGFVSFNGLPVVANITVDSKVFQSESFELPYGCYELTVDYKGLRIKKKISPVQFNIKGVWINGTALTLCSYRVDDFEGVVSGKFNLSFDLPPGYHEIEFVCENFTISKVFEVEGLHFPGDVVIIKSNSKPSKAFIQDPVGNVYNLSFTLENGSYVSRFELKRDVVLGRYTVVIDDSVEHFFVDLYSIDANFNGSYVVGEVKWYVVSPRYVTYTFYPLNLTGFAKVVDGRFKIEVPEGAEVAVVRCGRETVRIPLGQLDFGVKFKLDVGRFECLKFDGERIHFRITNVSVGGSTKLDVYFPDTDMQIYHWETVDGRRVLTNYTIEDGHLKFVLHDDDFDGLIESSLYIPRFKVKSELSGRKGVLHVYDLNGTKLYDVKVEVDRGNLSYLALVDSKNLPNLPARFPYQLLKFRIDGIGYGENVEVKITYPKLEGFVNYFKFNPLNLKWEFINCSVRDNTVILNLRDGGIGDEDGLNNGVIEDDGGVSTWRMEAGVVTLYNTYTVKKFTHVNFNQRFDDVPVVFALPTNEGYQSCALRIRNVTNTGFDIVQAEPRDWDGPHISMTIHYLAVEPGEHYFPDGNRILVGSVNTTKVQHHIINGPPEGWEHVTFDKPFSTTPIVIAMIQTMENEEANIPYETSKPFLTVAIQNVNSYGFDLALERSEDGAGNVTMNETVGYLVMDSGIRGCFKDNSGNEICYETIRSSDSIVGWDDGWTEVMFNVSYQSPPLVFATKNTHDGADGGWLRRRDITTTYVELCVDEDTAQDSERSHTTERAGILIFSRPFNVVFGLADTPWPKFHKDELNSGRSDHRGPRTGNLKWKFDVGARIRGSPVIGYNTIYVTSTKSLLALYPNGTVKWDFRLTNDDDWLHSTPAISEDTIYVGDMGHFYALHPNGTLKWRKRIGEIYSSPVIGFDGLVYVGSIIFPYSYVFAFYPNGTIKWKIELKTPVYSSPALSGDTLYVCEEGKDFEGAIHAIYINGSIKWSRLLKGFVRSSPVVYNDSVYVVSYTDRDTIIWRFDEDGNELGIYVIDDVVSGNSTPAVGNDTIYVAVGGKLYAFYPNLKLKWSLTIGKETMSSPAVDDSVVYVCFDNKIYAVEDFGDHAKILWVYEADDFVASSPSIDENTLYVGSDDGYLYAIFGAVEVGGRVFEDFEPLGKNEGEDVGIPGVQVGLFLDNGIQGVLDANDTLIATTITNESGYYNFTLNLNGTYFIAVNSSTLNTTRGLNEGYTIDDVWAEQTYQVEWNGSAWVLTQKFGGQDANRSDNWSAKIYEHWVAVNTSSDSIDFGFSFDVIVNTKDEDTSSNRCCQGCLRQFVNNANAIRGRDRSYFVMMTNPKWTITLNSTILIKDDYTELNGTVFYPNMSIRDENPGCIQYVNQTLKSSEVEIPVGVGSDGIPFSGDEPKLKPIPKPEIEIYGKNSNPILNISSNNCIISNLAIFGSFHNVYPGGVKSIGDNNVFENLFLGLRADGTDPKLSGFNRTGGAGIWIEGDNNTVKNSVVAFNERYGLLFYGDGVNSGRVEGVIAYRNGLVFSYGDNIGMEWHASNVTMERCVSVKASANGIESWNGGCGLKVLNCTVENNGIGNETGYVSEIAGVRVESNDSVLENNLIRNNGVGIIVIDYHHPTYNVTIKSTILNNTKLGIDLTDAVSYEISHVGDGVTVNDGELNSSQPNYGIDYPIITYARLDGDKLYVEGFVGNGSGSQEFSNSTVDIYLVKNSTGGDNLLGNNISDIYYGEGWIHLGSLTTNESGYFSGTIDASVKIGSLITSTATLPGYGTSEFGRDYLLTNSINVSVEIKYSLHDHLNITIVVRAYERMKNISVYWIKPENLTVNDIDGEYDYNGSTDNYYWWKFEDLNYGDVRHIYINASGNALDILKVGVDPEVVK